MKTPGVSSMHWRVARRHPSAFLLVAQLASLGLYAALDDIAHGRALLGAFGILVLALTVWVVNRSPAILWIAWVLVLPAFVLSLLSSLYPDPLLLVWSSLLEAALYFYGAGSLIAYMMEDYRVTIDELFAAGATFTLIAWGFAYLYLIASIGKKDILYPVREILRLLRSVGNREVIRAILTPVIPDHMVSITKAKAIISAGGEHPAVVSVVDGDWYRTARDGTR